MYFFSILLLWLRPLNCFIINDIKNSDFFHSKILIEVSYKDRPNYNTIMQIFVIKTFVHTSKYLAIIKRFSAKKCASLNKVI